MHEPKPDEEEKGIVAEVVVGDDNDDASPSGRYGSWYCLAWSAMRTVPIIAPVLFVAAVVGIHQTRHALHRLLRVLRHELHVDSGVIDDIKTYANLWISYTAIVDALLLATTILTSGLVRDRLRAALATTNVGRCALALESVVLGVLVCVAYVGLYVAIVFALVCAVAFLVAFSVREACTQSGSTAESATAFLANQIDQYTAVKVSFCTVDADDVIKTYENQVDDDRGFSDDDNCLSSIAKFCEPYVHGIYHNAGRLAIGAAIVAVVQINFALLALERYRLFHPLLGTTYRRTTASSSLTQPLIGSSSSSSVERPSRAPASDPRQQRAPLPSV